MCNLECMCLLLVKICKLECVTFSKDTSCNPFMKGLIINFAITFPFPRIHSSNYKPSSHAPMTLLCLFVAFPCPQLHFSFTIVLPCTPVKLLPTLPSSRQCLCLCYTAGQSRPPARYKLVLAVVYTTHQQEMQPSRH